MSLRDNFTLAFNSDRATPLWPCPTCHQGRLVLSEETLHLEETALSASWHDLDAWEPEFIAQRFVALVICENCGDPIVLAGEGHLLPPEYSEDGGAIRYDNLLEPQFVRPAPIIVPRFKDLPDFVNKLLAKAEVLFWSDRDACGNVIRCIVEEVLTERGVRKSARTRRGKLHRLPLHQRIVEYRDKRASNKSIAQSMLAVKWLGNAGSHAGGSLTADDLFDGFDLLHYVLEEVYGQRTKKREALAKRITKKKGPLSRKTK